MPVLSLNARQKWNRDKPASIASAVRELEQAAERLCALLGYHRATEPVTNTRQQVRVLFLRKQGSLDLKLIEPATPESPLWPFVKKGGGLHHICFQTDDVEAGHHEGP